MKQRTPRQKALAAHERMEEEIRALTDSIAAYGAAMEYGESYSLADEVLLLTEARAKMLRERAALQKIANRLIQRIGEGYKQP